MCGSGPTCDDDGERSRALNGSVSAGYEIAKSGVRGDWSVVFFVINWVDVPFSANLELMTVESVEVDLVMLPLIAAAAAAGILVLRRIPQRAFAAVVQVLAAAAAIKLLF